MPSDLNDGVMATVEAKARDTRRARGLGGVYQRGATWWIRYHHRGEEIREDEWQHRPEQGRRLAQASPAGAWPESAGESVRRDQGLVVDLLDALRISYQNNGRRSLDTLDYRLAALREAFGRDRAVDVTAPRIEAYKARRLAEKKKPATVNRELAALRRAFRLAVEQERIDRAPRITMLEEHNAREGFLEPGAFEAVVGHLPAYLQDASRFAYLWAGDVERCRRSRGRTWIAAPA